MEGGESSSPGSPTLLCDPGQTPSKTSVAWCQMNGLDKFISIVSYGYDHLDLTLAICGQVRDCDPKWRKLHKGRQDSRLGKAVTYNRPPTNDEKVGFSES